MMNRSIPALTLGLFLSIAAYAQFDLGSVVGTVKDTSGLAMARAAVEIRSLATNVVRKTATSATGDFDFVALQPGQYAVTAKQTGFKESTRNVEVAVGQRVELDLPMEVGTASESITVDANAVAVETISSDVSNVRTRQQVIDLPLNSRNLRNWYSLLQA